MTKCRAGFATGSIISALFLNTISLRNTETTFVQKQWIT